MSRPSREQTFMAIAMVVSKRGTCPRRQVGCVLVDHHNHVVATGYNGSAPGMPHCTESPCPGASYPPGQGYDQCQALHAEQNALLQCKDVYSIKEAYITCSPCTTCAKLLLSTSCERIIVGEYHSSWTEAEAMWNAAGRRMMVFYTDVIKIKMDF